MSRKERRKLLQHFYEKARPKRPAYRKRNKLSSKPADESSEKLQKGKKRKNSRDRDHASEGELAASKPADESSEKLQKGKKRKNSRDKDRASEGELAASKPADDDHASEVAAPESLPLMCSQKEPRQFDAEKLALLQKEHQELRRRYEGLQERGVEVFRSLFGEAEASPCRSGSDREDMVMELARLCQQFSDACGDLDSVSAEYEFFVDTSLRIAHYWRQQAVRDCVTDSDCSATKQGEAPPGLV